MRKTSSQKSDETFPPVVDLYGEIRPSPHPEENSADVMWWEKYEKGNKKEKKCERKGKKEEMDISRDGGNISFWE